MLFYALDFSLEVIFDTYFVMAKRFERPYF